MSGPRRSAGMRGDPLRPRPEAEEISAALPPRREAPPAAAPASGSSYPRPQVLMGEVIGPRGPESGAGREALRAFMLSRRLSPTGWAKDAGVPPGEVLAFLTGQARGLSPDTAAKLAEAAGTSPGEMFGERKTAARKNRRIPSPDRP